MKSLLVSLLSILGVSLLFLSCSKDLAPQAPEVNKPPQIHVTNTNNVSIQFPLDSVELTATITDPDDTAVTVHWSKLSGGDSLIIEHPDLVSTWVKGLKEGNYVIQLKATDAHGASIYDTITLACTPPDTLATTIHPSNNQDEVHLFGNSTGLDQTDTLAPELVGGSGTYLSDPVNIRALVKFDLSSIPSNAVIYRASLTLYSNHTPLNGQNNLANVGTDNSLYIQKVNSAWNHSTITWLNQPEGSSENQISIAHTDEAFLDLVNVDVTKLVTAMATENQNNGFLIKLQNEAAYNFRVFCSSKYSDETRHPKLEVSYYIK